MFVKYSTIRVKMVMKLPVDFVRRNVQAKAEDLPVYKLYDITPEEISIIV